MPVLHQTRPPISAGFDDFLKPGASGALHKPASICARRIPMIKRTLIAATVCAFTVNSHAQAPKQVKFQ